MNGKQILLIVEDLQRESMKTASQEFMACLHKVHEYVRQEAERDKEIANLKTRAFIADRSFDKYKAEIGQAI